LDIPQNHNKVFGGLDNVWSIHLNCNCRINDTGIGLHNPFWKELLPVQWSPLLTHGQPLAAPHWVKHVPEAEVLTLIEDGNGARTPVQPSPLLDGLFSQHPQADTMQGRRGSPAQFRSGSGYPPPTTGGSDPPAAASSKRDSNTFATYVVIFR
jgi:hypothetical protein